MPSKKKKYNSRFPPARIKKIMQTDEDVGKVAAAVPVIISRALELFIESLIAKTADITKAKNAKTLSTTHIKQTIQSEKKFDFLHDLVANVPDHQTEEDADVLPPSTAASGSEGRQKRQYKPRKPKDGSGPGRPAKHTTSGSSSDEETESDEDTRVTQPDTNTAQVPSPDGEPCDYSLKGQGSHMPPPPAMGYVNNSATNMPLNLSMSAQKGRENSPGTSIQGTLPAVPPVQPHQQNAAGPPISFPALSNFMNMAAMHPQQEDDDYDT